MNGRNYVTPVKDQGWFGTCWAFAATAAAETSLLYENGLDLNSLDENIEVLDLSERHLAWFSANPLPEDNPLFPSQAGEGMMHYGAELCRRSDDPDIARMYEDIFMGGFQAFAATVYSTLQGPAYESDVPYLTDEIIYGKVGFIDVLKDPAEFAEYKPSAFCDMNSLTLYEYSTAKEYTEYVSKEECLGEMSLEANNGWYKGIGRYWYNIADVDKIFSMDWAVDESLRFTGLELENSNMGISKNPFGQRKNR